MGTIFQTDYTKIEKYIKINNSIINKQIKQTIINSKSEQHWKTNEINNEQIRIKAKTITKLDGDTKIK